ncbi:putative disease resistance protein RGA3 [Typha latifolia]|uniref:putative disease resistance protein RGA3 n=1 Tax=Typha latifolia TaxID=4733 RepID=UPI003C2C7770
MFGSAAVGELVSRLTSFLGGRYRLHSDVEGKLQRLKELLLEIESVVEAAAGKEIKNKKLVEWLVELKDVAYEADDVLDTFEYRLLEKKANANEEVSSFAAASYNILLLPDEDVNELNTLLERSERMASKVGNFLTLLCLDGQSKKHAGVIGQRLTGSLPTFQHTFAGRVKEKEEIIDILLRTETYGAGVAVPVLPLLGMGGVGKTTLAQVVYNDERVQSHFSLKMWVCVSESFDVVKLTREIFDQACGHSGATSFNRLQEILKEKLSSQKFLLILDDVWNETERQAWDTLKAPLCYGKDGSKILLTSRLLKVARLMGTMDPLELQGLPEDEYWSFFKEQSFGGANPEEHPRLVAIGKEIASKLKGSPLAAKTVGGLLKDNLDVDHWESISKSEIWELEKGEDGIMAALKLSYLHLPSRLQQCFAYLSIYPKDWRFEREDVIRMWMAHGMIHHDSRTTKRIEDVGDDYFNELVSKSFFHYDRCTGIYEGTTIREHDRTDDFYELRFNSAFKRYKNYYSIHDLLHDLAESVSKVDCFRMEGDDSRTIPTTTRHLLLVTGHLVKLKENTSVLNNLRTLILLGDIFNDVVDGADLQDVIRKLKKVRLLALRYCNIEKCPENVSSLIHLYYMDLCGNDKIEDLSDELTKLYHLQTLDLGEMNLDRVPEGMNKLINLRHLICSNKIVSKVAGIGAMTCLQELRNFLVQKDPKFQIVQLRYLSELHGYLRIQNLHCLDSEEEAKEAMLCDKENLNQLHLSWGYSERNIKPEEVENGILEGLRPHPNLKELVISGYRGSRSPSWLFFDHYSLTNLVCLTLFDCYALQDLPPLGQLPYLKVLVLRHMSAVKEVNREFHGEKGFPVLERLTFVGLANWEVWSIDEDVPLFPRLQCLIIKYCEKLEAIPPLPLTLQELKIMKAGLTVLPKFLTASRTLNSSSSASGPSSSSSFRTLTIKGCTNMESTGEWFLLHHDNLRHLEELIIDHPYELKPLLLDGISELISLKSLHIRFSNLFVTSVGKEDVCLLPSSLEKLTLEFCSVVDNILSQCLGGLPSLQSLKIMGIGNTTTISFPHGLQQLIRLQKILITHCTELISFAGLEALPLLDNMEIYGCPKLAPLPCSRPDEVTWVLGEVGLSSVSTLLVDNTLLLKVLLSRQGFASVKILVIKYSNESEMDGRTLQYLTSLQELHITSCQSFHALHELNNLQSLKKLLIEYCPNFQSLPSKEGMPLDLQSLFLRKCHPVFEERYRKGDGPDWPAIAHIPDIDIV